MNGCKSCLGIEKNDPIFHLSDIYTDSTSSPCDTISIRDKLADCVPELRDIVNNAVICKPCVTLLAAAYDFRQQCIKVQHKVYGYLQQMPINTEIKMGEIAMYYKRQEVVAQETNPTFGAVCERNRSITYATADELNMNIKLEKLPLRYEIIMQQQNSVTEIVNQRGNTYLPPNTCTKIEKLSVPDQQKVSGNASSLPDQLNMIDKFQISPMQQQIAVHRENPGITTRHGNENSCSTLNEANMNFRTQTSAVPSNTYCNTNEKSKMQGNKKFGEVNNPNENFACSTCNYKCMTEYILKRHKRVHNEKYNIHCPNCEFRCATIHGLWDHLRFKHSAFKAAKKRKQSASNVAKKKEHSTTNVAKKNKQSASNVAKKKKQSASNVAKKKKQSASNVAKTNKHFAYNVATKKYFTSNVAKKKRQSASNVAKTNKQSASNVAKKKEHSTSNVAKKNKQSDSNVAKKKKQYASNVAKSNKHSASNVATRKKYFTSNVAKKKKQSASNVAKTNKQSASNVAKKKKQCPSNVDKKNKHYAFNCQKQANFVAEQQNVAKKKNKESRKSRKRREHAAQHRLVAEMVWWQRQRRNL